MKAPFFLSIFCVGCTVALPEPHPAPSLAPETLTAYEQTHARDEYRKKIAQQIEALQKSATLKKAVAYALIQLSGRVPHHRLLKCNAQGIELNSWYLALVKTLDVAADTTDGISDRLDRGITLRSELKTIQADYGNVVSSIDLADAEAKSVKDAMNALCVCLGIAVTIGNLENGEIIFMAGGTPL